MPLKAILLLTAIVCLVELPSTLWAQDSVSAATGSATGSSSSAETESSASGTSSPATGVTGSAGNGPLIEAPSSAGVFSRTPVRIDATVSAGYDDNVNTTNSPKEASSFTNGNVLLDYTFTDPRLQLILNGGAGATYYYEHINGQDYDIDLKGALDLTYRSSPRLTLGSTLLVEFLTEPSFGYAGGLNSRNGNYLYTTDEFFVTSVWSSHLSTKTSYAFNAYNYDNDAVATFSNSVTNTLGNEFRFLLVPTTTLVAEYRYSIESYPDSSLDSTTHFALGGIDHVFNPRFSGSFRGGAEFRSYDNDGDQTGPYFEGTLTYAVGKTTSFSWNNRYGLEEPDLPTQQSRTTFRSGLQTKLKLTTRIASTVDLYYVHDDYHSLPNSPVPSAPFKENTFDAGISFRYTFTTLFGIQIGYHYTDVSSDVAAREYSRNRVYGGANVTF